MRFLCLHGASTNAEIFEIQSGGLTAELAKKGHSFKFVNGGIETDAQKEFAGVLDGPFYNHYTRDTYTPGPTVTRAITHTQQLINTLGPFDGVMGFSQGAALACSMLIEHARRNPGAGPLFKCAVFICAGLPFEPDGSGPVQPADGLVDLPTAHIVGRQDEWYEEGMKLYGLCERSKAVLYDTGARHNIPFDAERTEKMVGAIEEVINRTS